ncbi:MAG: tetratricopeptide repeat protein [Minicystis sp.]
MSRRPRLVPGCNITSLPLTPADAFLLSRVDATASEHDLALITGFPPEQVAAMLDRLAALGAVELSGGSGSQIRLRATPDPARAPAANATHASAGVTPPLRPAGVTPPLRPAAETEGGEDLHALRRQVLARKLSGTHGAVTGGTPVRRPVTEPDAVNLRRTAEALNAHYEKDAAEARQAEVAQSLEKGKSALAGRDFEGAINHYRMAASLAPEDAKVQSTCNDAIRTAAGALAQGYWEQAVRDESEGNWEDAALGYAKVCAGRPNDARAHERVANAAIRAGNARRAVEFARKAIEITPGSAIFRITLARAYAAAGLEKSAHGELGRALELAPDDAKIRNLVSRVVEALTRRTGKAS